MMGDGEGMTSGEGSRKLSQELTTGVSYHRSSLSQPLRLDDTLGQSRTVAAAMLTL